MSLNWPSKYTVEAEDYKVDWTSKLAGDTIATSVFTIAGPAGSTITAQTNTTTTATVWIAGGTPGLPNLVSNVITTAAERTFKANVTLLIAADNS